MYKLPTSITAFLLFAIANCFSQIQPAPNCYKKIFFVYETSCNYKISGDVLYADTTYFKVNLPKQPFGKMKSPEDSTKVVGFITNENTTQESKDYLSHMVYHYNQKSEHVFDPKKKRTKVTTHTGLDQESKKIWDFLGFLKLEGNTQKTTVYYEANYYIRTYNNTNNYRWPQNFNYKDNTVKWQNEEKTVGTFELTTPTHAHANAIVANPLLNRYITMAPLFVNCQYGIEELYSLSATTKLISVRYE